MEVQPINYCLIVTDVLCCTWRLDELIWLDKQSNIVLPTT